MRGKDIGQSRMREILEIAFGSLKLHRVSLRAYDFNKSAIATYEKVGFTLEGILRDA